jgi:hypothetical protein
MITITTTDTNTAAARRRHNAPPPPPSFVVKACRPRDMAFRSTAADRKPGCAIRAALEGIGVVLADVSPQATVCNFSSFYWW